MQRFRKNQKLLILKLHGGLGDQLYMFFSAVELARSTSRRLVLCKWTIDRTHTGSPFGLLDLVSHDIPVELTQRPSNKIFMKFHQYISGILRGRFSEIQYFRLIKFLNRFFGIVNNVTSFNYDLADSGFIQRELGVLRCRKRIQLDCYFSTVSVDEGLNLKAMLPGLSKNALPPIVLPEGYAVAHFRVGDIFDTYTSRGVLSSDYYESCLRLILEIDSRITVYGVSDNIKRAKTLYPDLPLVWINDSDKFDALTILRLLSNSRFLVTANSGLSLWAGRLGSRIEKVYAPIFLRQRDLSFNTRYEPFHENWELVVNNFISQD